MTCETFLCGEPSAHLTRRGNCLGLHRHTPAPSGYMEWFDWAKTMSKTHKQKKCRNCGSFAIWVLKPRVRHWRKKIARLA